MYYCNPKHPKIFVKIFKKFKKMKTTKFNVVKYAIN
jgi:hypothetical protein